MNISDVFTAALDHRPDHEALVTRSGRWTYRELDGLCARAATALGELGVRSGDRVAACLPNDVDIIAAFHGAMRVGAIWVGINQALAPPEKAFLLGDSGSTIFLCDPDTATAIDARRAEVPELRQIVELDRWRATVEASAPATGLPEVDSHAAAGLSYTSGTTGRPKGVIHSQYNLLLPGRVLVESRGYGPDLRKGDCLPLTIINMLVLTTLLVAQAEGTVVIMDQIYAEGVADWVERERVMVWNGPPALLHSLITSESVTPDQLKSLQEVWSGGADLPETLRDRFLDRFGIPLMGTYGLSEAPTVVSIDPVDGDHVERASGRVLPHLEVTLADDTDGMGEICLSATSSGPYAGAYRPPLGYWNRPEASAALIEGGVVHTGDIGFVDDGGWLHVRDRKNLVILRGGANVYPAEIERVLHAVEGVAGSAVLGIPDERLGERVVAAIELEEGATVSPTEIGERCGAELARYKVPERIEIVDQLPRNSMGKVNRTSLIELFD